jgi:anti-sigma factor RsiW
MSSNNRLGDLELCTVADGELDAEALQTLQTKLEGDELARGNIAWQQALNGRLHQTYDGILSGPLPARTMRLLRPRPRFAPHVNILRIAAVVAIAVITGYFADLPRLGGDVGELQVARLALGAHQVFAREIEHPVEVGGADSDRLAKWLGKRLGVSLIVPAVPETGFKLVGGRLLAEGDKPAALLMYEDGTGRRISLFIEKWASKGETSMRLASAGGLSSYSWIDSPLACAVSGDLASDELKAVAEHIYVALAKS